MVFLGTIFLGCQQENKKTQVEQWEVYEIELKGPSSGNPFTEVELSAIFEKGEEKFTVPGFYEGEGIYRIRFSPGSKGNWVYRTQSNIEELSQLQGGFICVPASGNNHGPVRIVNIFYLEYADGSPFYSVGTTAYQWTSVKQNIQAKTLETLAEAPFNKIRMCVFPKSYRYGNETDPWAYPFERVNDSNDLTKLNFEFFQNFDLRVRQLLDLGIQADVILFHPYDAWGYSQMGDEMNLNSNFFIFSKPGTYYLAYMADSGQSLEINLEGEGTYKMEIIDIWNMEIKSPASVGAGIFKYQSPLPYMALRFIKE